MRTIVLLAALLGLLTTNGLSAPASSRVAAVQRVSDLLRAYSAKNVAAVMSMLDPTAAMYGTALSEFYTTPSGIRRLLRDDYRQWSSSSFGNARNVTVATSGGLQTVFFDAPFTATYGNHERHTFVIRFATVWHNVGNRWLLVQSMNAVPTGG